MNTVTVGNIEFGGGLLLKSNQTIGVPRRVDNRNVSTAL